MVLIKVVMPETKLLNLLQTLQTKYKEIAVYKKEFLGHIY
jgi:hypothetical protein